MVPVMGRKLVFCNFRGVAFCWIVNVTSPKTCVCCVRIVVTGNFFIANYVHQSNPLIGSDCWFQNGYCVRDCNATWFMGGFIRTLACNLNGELPVCPRRPEVVERWFVTSCFIPVVSFFRPYRIQMASFSSCCSQNIVFFGPCIILNACCDGSYTTRVGFRVASPRLFSFSFVWHWVGCQIV